jgi:hypothetical protein
LGTTLLKREELVAQIDEGGSGALTPQFEIEQSTVESQSLFHVTDLERYMVETDRASFSCFSHGVLQLGDGSRCHPKFTLPPTLHLEA